MNPFKIEVDQDALNEIIQWHINEVLDEDLSGITWALTNSAKSAAETKAERG